jgi:Putative MetA-pathway of phenol degradation
MSYMVQQCFKSVPWTAALVGVLVLLVGAPIWAEERNTAPATDSEDVNDGEDPTRPLTRFDFRYEYEALSGGRGEHIFTPRVDKRFVLGHGWQLASRLDMPFVYTDVSSADNPNGAWTLGTGDLLVQGLLVKHFDQWHAAALGARLEFPTASQDQFGTGRYQLEPTVAYRYSLHDFSPGSFVAGLIRYAFDYAGDAASPHISVLQLQPQLNIHLSRSWFVELYPSPDIRINFLDHNKLFLPLDVMVGKLVTPTLVASLEVSAPIVKDYDLYNFKLEAHIGFFF